MKAKTVKEVPCGHAPRNFPPKSNVMNLSLKLLLSFDGHVAFALISAAAFTSSSSKSMSLLLMLAAQRNRKRAPARGTLCDSQLSFFL